MSKHRLLLTEKAFARVGAKIEQLGEDITLSAFNQAQIQSFNITKLEKPNNILDATVAWLSLDIYQNSNPAMLDEILLNSPGLDWVHTAIAGVEAPIFGKLLERGVRITNSDAQAPSVAEFTLGNILSLFQNHNKIEEYGKKKRWAPIPFREIQNTKWLILGYGSIGKELDKRLRAFGAEVVAVRRNSNSDDPAYVTTVNDLGKLIPQCDVVVLACALSRETRGIVDRNFLEKMKPESILVNIGRGGLILEDDLLSALERGNGIETAILDVFDIEPLPENHPYWSHPKVRVTSHNASFGDGMADRADELFLNNLKCYLADQPLRKEISNK